MNTLAATVLSALIASIWLGACLVIAASLLIQALPALEARWRYRVWLSVLIVSLAGLFALPVARRTVVVEVPPLDKENAVQASARVGNAVAPPTVSEPVQTVAWLKPVDPVPARTWQAPAVGPSAKTGFELPSRVADGLVALLIAGAMLALGRVALQLLALGRLKRRAGQASARLSLLWREAQELLPTRRPVRVLISSDIRLPVACGYLRPAVLVPGAISESLTDEETRHLLLHELAHLVRRDDWGLLTERVIGALCWWHPVVWVVARRLEQEREQACDGLVAAQSDRRRYARTLVHLGELASNRPDGLAPGALRGRLTQRVEALLAGPVVPDRTTWLGDRGPAAVLAGVALIGAFRISPPPLRTTSSPLALPAATQIRVTWATGFAAGPEGLALDSLLTNYADSGFSGTVLLARRGEIILHKGYGLADRERGLPATAGTRYSTAGMTKLFTATALLQLATEGKLDIDDSVSRWVGPLPGAKSAVTLDELLTYRDGLTRWNAPVQRAEAREFVRALGLATASFTPGKGYRYNDHGHSLLGLVIERAAGEPYESYIRRRFLQPAGLAATAFENEGGEVAVEYAGPAGALTPVAPRAYRWGRRASLGLVSTAGDLYRWFQTLSDSAVVSPAVRRQLFQVRSRTDYDTDQAYGLELVDRGSGHHLWRRVAGTPGFEGEVLYDPDSDWTAVILVNTRLGWRFRVWRDIERAMWQ